MEDCKLIILLQFIQIFIAWCVQQEQINRQLLHYYWCQTGRISLTIPIHTGHAQVYAANTKRQEKKNPLDTQYWKTDYGNDIDTIELTQGCKYQ